MTAAVERRLLLCFFQRQCLRRYRHSGASTSKGLSFQPNHEGTEPDIPALKSDFKSDLSGVDRNPLPLFLEPKVQTLLKDLAGYNIEKIASPKLVKGSTIPTYKLMAEDEIEKAKLQEMEIAENIMQMPPFMEERKEINEVLSSDPEIAPCLDSKFVFTDISHGVSDRDRIIVVREKDGTLRKAHWDERDRMNQIYHPQPGRTPIFPIFFRNHENILRLLSQEQHRYVLDKACVQFEPEDKNFINVFTRVYTDIVQKRNFDVLESTRFFGHMAFFLAWKSRIAELMIHFLNEDHGLSRASNILDLRQYLYQETDDLLEKSSKSQTISKLQKYATKMKDSDVKKELMNSIANQNDEPMQIKQ